MVRKKYLFPIFAVVFSFFSFVNLANAENITINVDSVDKFNEAKIMIQNDTTDSTYTISIQNDIEGYTLWSSSSHEITIDGNGHKVSAPNNYDSAGLYMGAGTLNLKNVIIDGGSINRGVAGVYISNINSILNIYDGTIIRNFKVDNYIGGGIAILRGKVKMYGGTIENNQIYSGSVHAGAGVGIQGQGVFELYNGTIQNNHITATYYSSLQPSYGGGVAVLNGGQFYMHGGTIKGNSANCGGGVGVTHYRNSYTSTFYMDGGVIEENYTTDNAQSISIGGGISVNGYYDNSAAMVAPNFSQFPLQEIEKPGVYIKGGTIRKNTAILGGGGIGLMFNSLNKNIPEIDNVLITENNGGELGGGIFGLTIKSGSTYYTGLASLGSKTKIHNNEAEEGADLYTDAKSKITGLPDASKYGVDLKLTKLPITNWYEDYYGEEGEERWSLDNITNIFEGADCYNENESVALIVAHGPVYSITYTDGVEDEDIFEDQVYKVLENYNTPAFNGTPERKGYKFIGWSPNVEDKVTGDITYIAQWEIYETEEKVSNSNKPTEVKSDKEEINPNTSDSIMKYVLIYIVSILGIIILVSKNHLNNRLKNK